MRKEGIGRGGGRKEEGGERRGKKGGLSRNPHVMPGQQLPGKHKEGAFYDVLITNDHDLSEDKKNFYQVMELYICTIWMHLYISVDP